MSTPTDHPSRRLRTRAAATALGRQTATTEHAIERLASGNVAVAATARRLTGAAHNEVTGTAHRAAEQTRWTLGVNGRDKRNR